MIDEKATPDGRSRMNFDSREEAADLGDNARQQRNAHLVQPMGEPMRQNRVKPGIAEEDFQHALGGWIFMKNRIDLFPDRLEHRRTIMTQQRTPSHKGDRL